MPVEKSAEYVWDGFRSFEAGVNTGLPPSLLPQNQLSHAVNCSLALGLPSPRLVFRKCPLDFGGDTVLQGLFEGGRFQSYTYYRADTGPNALITSIGGHLFRVTVDNETFKVSNITVSHQTVTTAVFTVPAVGGTVSVSVHSTANLRAGVPILIAGKNYTVFSIDTPTSLTVQNVDDTPGSVIVIGAVLTYYDTNPASIELGWMWQSEKWVIVNDGQSVPIFYDGAQSRRSDGITAAIPEITAGRMGTYWQGRNWWCNTDGRTFRAGDVVYSSSGSIPQNKRDAVLKQTQNTFLAQGGDFSCPSAGEIRAMRFVNILDASLGQGPLQVLTPELVFGCTAPVDDTLWQTTKNPLLTVSQISYGGQGQNSTQLVSGDLFYRSTDGIRSLVLGRRDVGTWGNTPISLEVSRYIETDDLSLLEWGSAIVFDNRMLMTCIPTYGQNGVYHQAIVSLNSSVISTLRGRMPAAWEGMWTGLNTLGLVKGDFGGVERAFAFVWNKGRGAIELYEILTESRVEITDNNDTDTSIQWAFETADLFRKTGTSQVAQVRLEDGELYIDDLQGVVNIRVLWRPDQYPCWREWRVLNQICAATTDCTPDDNGCVTIREYPPQYRVRLGLGQPNDACDPILLRPYRQFYTCNIRIEVTGHCRVRGGLFKGVRIPEPQLAPVA